MFGCGKSDLPNYLFVAVTQLRGLHLKSVGEYFIIVQSSNSHNIFDISMFKVFSKRLMGQIAEVCRH